MLLASDVTAITVILHLSDNISLNSLMQVTGPSVTCLTWCSAHARPSHCAAANTTSWLLQRMCEATQWQAQLRLLRPSTSGSTPGDPAISKLLGLPSLQGLPFFKSLALQPSTGASISSPSQFYAHVTARVCQVVAAAMSDQAAQDEPVKQLLEAGASCLHVFLQHNLTGPWHPVSPSPIELLAPHLASERLGGTEEAVGLGDTCQHPHDRWASTQLAIDGEEVLGSCSGLQYLLLAKLFLAQPLLGPAAGLPLDGTVGVGPEGATGTQEHDRQRPVPCWQPGVKDALLAAWPSWSVWALRVTCIHQQILEGRSARLWACTQLLTQHLVSSWAVPVLTQLLPEHQTSLVVSGQHPPACGPCVSGLAQERSLLACLLIELALGQFAYGYVEPGGTLLREAGAVLGLEVELTGALGTRTVHQVDPKAQLVVRAIHARREAAATQDQGVPVQELGLGVVLSQAEAQPGRETAGLVLEEDVLMVPKLLDEAGQVLDNVYTPAEQMLLLSWAQAIKSGTAQDELQAWQMAPYVEAVLAQKHSQPILQAQAQLLKIRHEKGRNRTRERALLHMEQLVDALKDTQALQQDAQGDVDPGVISAARAPFCLSTSFPLASRLRKELAEQYMALGFVGAAVKMFEALEAWGALVLCYRLLEKKNLAEEIIQRRLKVTPDDPALWCSLGDLHLDDSYYEIAWQRSGCRHARSKRSLGRSALRRKDWSAAVQHYEAALALNPLNPDAWFSLGYAYLKIPDQHYKALKAFTRVTQQVPDHAEAWNNMAALWLDLGKKQEAFSALSQCVKHKRDSWQIWENYSESAVKAGQAAQAVHGLRQVIQLSGGQRLPLAVVKSLLDHLEQLEVGELRQEAIETQAAVEVDEIADTEGEELGAWVLDLPGMPTSSAAASGAQPDLNGQQGDVQGTSRYQQDVVLAEERAREQFRSSLGSLLKDGVNQPCCSPDLWGCLGRYYALTGHQESAKEALLKQVRALTGTSYKSDEGRFVEMATASIGLASAYVQLYKQQSSTASEIPAAGPAARSGATRELAAARMHLRGVLKQCEQAFQEHPKWKQMEQLLSEVTQLEADAAKTASG